MLSVSEASPGEADPRQRMGGVACIKRRLHRRVLSFRFAPLRTGTLR
jgi:hypothetical protein